MDGNDDCRGVVEKMPRGDVSALTHTERLRQRNLLPPVPVISIFTSASIVSGPSREGPVSRLRGDYAAYLN